MIRQRHQKLKKKSLNNYYKAFEKHFGFSLLTIERRTKLTKKDMK